MPDSRSDVTPEPLTVPREHAFDDELAAKMELMYVTADVVRRRELVHTALAATPGQQVADVGCGPGFSVAALAGLVGPTGSVVGIDASTQMLTAAETRCSPHTNARLLHGQATSLPLTDASVDAAICVQVLEYVSDPGAALRELARVLRPGGRVVIWDVDWSTVSWHSNYPDRMTQVLRAFDEHVAHPALPRTLSARLRAAGFTDIRIDGHCFATDRLDPDSYVGAVIWPIIEAFIIGRANISATRARAWAVEQQELHAADEFFFSCTQFCLTATRSSKL